MLAWVVPASWGVNYSRFTGKQCNTLPQSHTQTHTDVQWYRKKSADLAAASFQTSASVHGRQTGAATPGMWPVQMDLQHFKKAPNVCWYQNTADHDAAPWTGWKHLKFLFFNQTFQLKTPNQMLVPSDQWCLCWDFSEDLIAITHKYWFAERSIIL